MLGSVVVAVAFLYLAALFALAAYADGRRPFWLAGPLRPWIYALGLGVYCTSWAFFGSVGFAAQSGWSFVALSVGPALALILFGPTIRRIIRLAKSDNITSVADFIGARYGKSELVAGLVAVAAIAGVTPYVALQLKAISSSLELIAGPGATKTIDPGFAAAAALALFAALFGTRQVAPIKDLAYALVRR